MVRFIEKEHKRKLSEKDSYKIGEPVIGMKAIAPIKGKEQIGSVVYRRKAEYKDIFESHS